MSLYVAAFVLMLAAGVLVAAGSPPFGDLAEGSLRLLRISMWVSGAAIVLAAASVLAPRRR